MWKIIFKKEFREVFGDARTRFNVIVSPLLITPLLLALIGSMARQNAKEMQTEKITVGVIGLQNAPKVSDALKNSESRAITLVSLRSAAEAEQKIKNREIRAAAIVSEDADERFGNLDSVPITILKDDGNDNSTQAAGRLKELFQERGELIAAERLHENGFSAQLTRPFLIGEKAITGSGGAGMAMLATLLPYILAISAIVGGISAANDSVAGEKERGTLETLLVSPISRRDIAFGKFCSVTATALVSSFLSIVGFLWPFYVKLPMFAWMSQGGLTLTPSAVAAMLLVQLPLAVLGAGVLLIVSTISRNQKEAQTYISPVILIVTVGAMLSILLKSAPPLFWALVPITNAALVLKQALQGNLSVAFVAIACIASLVYAAIAVFIAAQLFQKESVLLKT
jgi:sodium transport system permease protein